MVQTTLSCRYAAIHLVYLGFYTREEKMCPEDAVFLQHSIESVVSIERLLGKRSFFDSLKMHRNSAVHFFADTEKHWFSRSPYRIIGEYRGNIFIFHPFRI